MIGNKKGGGRICSAVLLDDPQAKVPRKRLNNCFQKNSAISQNCIISKIIKAVMVYLVTHIVFCMMWLWKKSSKECVGILIGSTCSNQVKSNAYAVLPRLSSMVDVPGRVTCH